MEDIIKNAIRTSIIITAIVVYFSVIFISIIVTDQTNKVLDRIEQLEAQIDQIERTNKQ